MGKGRRKSIAKELVDSFLTKNYPKLAEFISKFPPNKQAEVKQIVGFIRLLEANEMVDKGTKPEQFTRRLQIVDRTLPRIQEYKVESKTALIVGKMSDLIKLYQGDLAQLPAQDED